jgi:hypothetical protein
MIIYNLLNKYRKYGHRKNRLDNDFLWQYWSKAGDYYIQYPELQWDLNDYAYKLRPFIPVNMLKGHLSSNK